MAFMNSKLEEALLLIHRPITGIQVKLFDYSLSNLLTVLCKSQIRNIGT